MRCRWFPPADEAVSRWLDVQLLHRDGPVLSGVALSGVALSGVERIRDGCEFSPACIRLFGFVSGGEVVHPAMTSAQFRARNGLFVWGICLGSNHGRSFVTLDSALYWSGSE